MNVTPEAWEEINCRLEAIEIQRNNAQTEHAIAAARLKVANQKLAIAGTKITELEAKVAELEKPKE